MATEEAVDGLDQPDPDNTDADGQVVADSDQPEAGGSVANFSREPLSLRIKVFLFFFYPLHYDQNPMLDIFS